MWRHREEASTAVVLLLLLLTIAIGSVASAQSTEVEAVPVLDLERYAGLWYEIARFPNRFQDDCAGEVTAEYSLRDDGRIDASASAGDHPSQIKRAQQYGKEFYRFGRGKGGVLEPLEFIIPDCGLAVDSPRESDPWLAITILQAIKLYPEPQEIQAALTQVRKMPGSGEDRLILMKGGSDEVPFDGWLSLHVPAFVAKNTGRYEKVLYHLQAFEPLFSPKEWYATSMTAWFLSQALQSQGEPKQWLANLPKELRNHSEGETTLKILQRPDSSFNKNTLGDNRDLATLHHALRGFAHHPYNPQLGFEKGLKSPPTIREDVLTILGAFYGAFHGRGIFPLHELIIWGRIAASDYRRSPQTDSVLHKFSQIAYLVDMEIKQLKLHEHWEKQSDR